MTEKILLSGVHDAKNILFGALEKMSTGANGGCPLEIQLAIEQASERLNKMLATYRMANGKLQPAICSVDARMLVEEAVMRCFEGYDGPVAAVINELADEEWPLDRELVQDAIINALNNAKRFAATKVVIESQATAHGLVITIADDGPGYPMAAAPETLTDETGHSGMGLILARHIAALHQRHGGKGELQTFTGGPLGGAVFQLTLP